MISTGLTQPFPIPMNRPLAAGSNSCDDGGDSVTNAALSGNPLSNFAEIINFAQFTSGTQSIPNCGLVIAELGSRLARSLATNPLLPPSPSLTHSTDFRGLRCSMASQSADTSTGMLGRVQAGDTHAWAEFAERCRSVVTDWCRWHNLQCADTDDIVQETLLVVMHKIRGFDRAGRGSLRAWLRGIAWRCWCRAVARADRATPESLRSLLQSSYDDIAQLEAEYDRLAQLESLQKAMAVVQRRVTSNTWQAFCLTALHNHSGAQAGEVLGMTADAVHSSRARVQRLISAEIRRQSSNPTS